jgi:hypothetical protein
VRENQNCQQKTKAGTPELLPVPACASLNSFEDQRRTGVLARPARNLVARRGVGCRCRIPRISVAGEAAQSREERRYFKRHFVTRGRDRHRR